MSDVLYPIFEGWAGNGPGMRPEDCPIPIPIVVGPKTKVIAPRASTPTAEPVPESADWGFLNEPDPTLPGERVDMLGSVLAFHQKYNQPIGAVPELGTEADRALRARLILEEAREFAVAAKNADLVGMADGIADLLYVAFGAAITFGLPIETIFAEVHRSNMTKTGGKDAGGKVTKGEGYDPPKIEPILTMANSPKRTEVQGEFPFMKE